MNTPNIGLLEEDDDENEHNNNKNHFSANALNNGCDRRGPGGKLQKLKKQVQASILKLFTK